MEYVDYTVLFENMSNEELLDRYRGKDLLLHSDYCFHSVKDVLIFQDLFYVMDERGLVYYSKFIDIEGRCSHCNDVFFDEVRNRFLHDIAGIGSVPRIIQVAWIRVEAAANDSDIPHAKRIDHDIFAISEDGQR